MNRQSMIKIKRLLLIATIAMFVVRKRNNCR